MSIRKYRWSKDYESAEEELVELLTWRNIDAIRHVKEEEIRFTDSTETEPVRLWCAEGSFLVHTKDKNVSMQPGDTIEIPKGQTYEVQTGIAGCIYYQAAY